MIDGTKLAQLRYDRGLSQRRLAAAAGVDALTIKRLEDGADGGELPIRVVWRIAQAFGVSIDDLLSEHSPGVIDEVESVGATLVAHGSTSTIALSHATGLDLDLIDLTLDDLTRRLANTGIGIARHGAKAKLVPAVDPAVRGQQLPGEIDVNQARLLRRIHRGEDVRRALSRVERELILPSLLRSGLATTSNGLLALTEEALCGLDINRDVQSSVQVGAKNS